MAKKKNNFDSILSGKYNGKQYKQFDNGFDAIQNNHYSYRQQTKPQEEQQPQQQEEQKKDGFFDNWINTDAATKNGFHPIRNILATAGDIGLNVTGAIMGMGEGLGDLANYGVAAVQDALGYKDAANQRRQQASENAVGETINWIKKNTGIDKYSLSGDKLDNIENAIGTVLTITSTAGLGGAVGLGTKGATALTTGEIFASSMGSGMGEAYQGGATDEEALKYGLISGAAEAGSEMIFGGLGKGFNVIGIGKGLSGADDMLAKTISNKFKSRLAKNLSEYAIKSGAEGLEEVVSGMLQGYGKYLTYQKDRDLGAIIKDEKLLDQFIAGMVSSGVSQSFGKRGLIQSTKDNRDFITGLTDGEQRQVDKLTEKQVKNMQDAGKTVTNKQISEIREQQAQKILYRNQVIQQFRDNSVQYYPGLDNDNRKLYNDLINDTSQLMRDTGLEIEFNPYSNQLMTMDGDKIVMNPAMTDMPIKAMLLKGLSNNLLTDESKQTLLNYVKETGTYNDLRQQLLDSGEFTEQDVDNEIVARTLNNLFENQEELKKITDNHTELLNDLKSNVEDLVNNISQERTTKDATFLRNLGEQLNISTIQEIENNATKQEEKQTQNQLEKVEESKVSQEDIKQKQLDIIDKTNKAPDEYHTWIRSKDDINTFKEAYETAKTESKEGGWDNYASYPDITNELVNKALETGKITVYSSYPIENGVFVTPSYQQALDYAGSDKSKVYSKEVNLGDVAWMNLDEGQYAKVEENEAKQPKKETKTETKQKVIDVYHGTPNPGFTKFEPSKGKSVFGKYKFKNYEISYFTKSKETAIGYTDIGVEENGNVYRANLNFVNPYTVENSSESEIKTWKNIKDNNIRKYETEYYNKFENKWNTYKDIESNLDKINEDLFPFNCELRLNGDYYDLYDLGKNDGRGEQSLLYVDRDAKTSDLFKEELKENIYGVSFDDYNYATDDIVKWVLTMNTDGYNYDGIIIPDIIDTGIKGNVFSEPTTDYITFYSDQIEIQNDNNKDVNKNVLLGEEKKETKTEVKQDDTELKERKAYNSVMKSQNQTKEAKKTAKKLMGVDRFVPDSNVQELQRADEYINKYGVEKSLETLRANTENVRNNVDDIAIGNRLIEYYSLIGDGENLQEAIQLTAMAGTNVGRAVQAMSLINRQTPAGKVLWIERSVNRLNKGLQEAYNKSHNKHKKLYQFEFTSDMQKRILEADSKSRDNVVDNVLREIGEQVPMSAMDKFDTWRYYAMLSSPSTHIRNIVGNLTMGGVQNVKNKIRGGIEDIYYGVTGKEGERTNTFKITPKEYKQFAENDLPNVQTRLSGSKYLNPKNEITKYQRMFKNNLAEKVVKKGLIDTVNNLLEAEDVGEINVNLKKLGIDKKITLKLGGLESAYKKAMAQYLYANNIDLKNITDKQLAQARNYAVDQAKQATFHQDNHIATLLNQLENTNGLTKVTIGGLIPFKKTPLNVAKTALEYNPAGLLKTLTIDSAKLYNGKITANQYIDNLAKGLTGTGIALLGYALAKMGWLRTTSDDDESYDEDKGVQPYSIVLGDKTISLDWLSPTAVPLFVGAEISNQLEQRFKDVPENERLTLMDSAMSVLDAGVSSLNPVSEMTMLSGIQSALRSYNQDYSKAFEQVGVNTIKNYASQVVPSVLGKIARDHDEYERSTTSTKSNTVEKAIDQFKNQIMSKIPGVRKWLPVKTDVWGNEVKQDEDFGTRVLQNLVSPAIVKPIRETKLDKEIERLYDSTGESKVLPKTYITKKLTYDNKDYNLTNQEYAAFKAIVGKENYNKLNELIQSEEYKTLSDAEKATVISKVYSYDRDAMKVAYAKAKNITYKDDSYQTEKEVENLGGKVTDYYLYKAKINENDTSYQKKAKLKNAKISDKSKSAIYEASTSKSTYDLYQVLKESNVNINDYLDYLSIEFTADKDANGNTIADSKKRKMYNYFNTKSRLTLEQKMLILSREYTLNNAEKNYVAYRIKNSRLSTNEKLELYKSLKGFKVDSNGSVRW